MQSSVFHPIFLIHLRPSAVKKFATLSNLKFQIRSFSLGNLRFLLLKIRVIPG